MTVKKRGFKEAQRDALTAIKDGRIQHEPRATLGEKNLLAIGDVDATFTSQLIQSTASRNASSNAHHFMDVEVWTFKPSFQGVQWYVKFYFIDDIWFISVHKSESEGVK